MSDGYAERLAEYISAQRWFAGKGRDFAVEHVEALEWLNEKDPAVRIELVTVRYEDGTHDLYQVPVAYLGTADLDLGHAHIANVDHPELGSVAAYDAVFLKPAADALLGAFRDGHSTPSFSFHTLEGAELPEPSTPGTAMTAEQSNTSIAYGDSAILKLFRRVSAGANPDVEIHAALTEHGSEHVAPLFGWVSARWPDPSGGGATLPAASRDGAAGDSGRPASAEDRVAASAGPGPTSPGASAGAADRAWVTGHLAMLQAFLRTATDGWVLATSSVRDLLAEEDLHADEVGGDFAAEAARLGETTAAVHLELAEVFDTGLLDRRGRDALSRAMTGRLEHAVAVVPELHAYVEPIRRRFAAVADIAVDVPVQRVHGDLHLGQMMRTVKNWKVIDFEGEPAKSLAERVTLESPLRDVAGMLRSLDYAAGSTLHQFGDQPHLGYRADEWTSRNSRAFLAGYQEVAGELDDVAWVLLLAYEADKAVYEAVYEARNRPSWLPIPLHGVEQIAAEA
ncbi:MAG TPA: aminoglycoside phosphotransferase [Nocardioidaceae bacterium]|nr:aminoglycoside phosphotransferase [Nocardioidaceae bacterium]